MNTDNKILQTKIDELENSISDTRDEFLIKMRDLNDELSLLRDSLTLDDVTSSNEVVITTSSDKLEQVDTDSLVTQNNRNKASFVIKEKKQTHLYQTPEKPTKQASHNSSIDWSKPDETPESKQPKKPEEPGIIQVFTSKLINAIFGFILNSLSIFAAPFQEFYHKLSSLFSHYQKQGKAPVFLMTVAGLITLTVGFGYLLQYSFYSLFNDTLKTITGFAIGTGIIGAGVLLGAKKTYFRDYAASVIALGIIFNYLTAYFVGPPHYGFVSETTSLLLLLIITLISFSLALLFETRVVSSVTLVGGVFMPFILGDADSAGAAFLVYLFFLSMGNLYLSYKIKWPSLSHITFFLSLSVIEYIGISESVHPFMSIVFLTGFFYVYSYYWSFDGLKLKQVLSKHDLTILLANAFYFIYVMLQLPVSNILLASLLILHALIFVFFVKNTLLLKNTLAPIYLLIIGLLIATAAFVLMPINVASIIWSLEGLAMLYIGFQYSRQVIRAEAYVIYFIAMTGLLWQTIETFSSVYDTTTVWHWINLFAFGILSLTTYRMINYFKQQAIPIEQKIAYVLNEIFTLWGAVALSISIILYLTQAITILAVLPMLWCFNRAFRHHLRFAQFTAYLFFSVFIVQIILGIFDTNSLVISQQSFITWIALVELLFFSWFLYFYYQRFNIVGKGQSIATRLHQLFFYSPFVLTGVSLFSLYEFHYIAHQPLTFSYLWGDFIVIGCLLFIAFMLVYKTKKPEADESRTQHNYILHETLSFYASTFFLYTVAILFTEWAFNAAILPLLFLLYRGLHNDLVFTEKLAWAHFTLFGIMTLMSYDSIGNLHFSEQTWATRIGWLEVLLSAWAMQSIYERLEDKQAGHKMATYVRVGVYLFLPVMFLPRIMRLYNDYLPVALWGSFTISWLMYKVLKITPLLKELIVLFFIAIIASVHISLNALSGEKELPGLIALITGAVVISLFHVVEKTLSKQSIKDSIYYSLQISSPYYYGFCLAALSYAITHQVLISLLITGLYFLYLLSTPRFYIVLRKSINLSYILAWTGLISIPILVFLQWVPANINMVLINITAMVSLWYLTHQRSAIMYLLRKKFAGYTTQYWVFHFVVFLTYIGSLNLLFTSWAVGTSIMMLIHAVILLFLTLSVKYKKLMRLSIILYFLTALKVLFHDMYDFGNLHKIIALMGIGSILMIAAFAFQKFQNKQRV
ncbi:MAG: DUF2339 domain-containing protein [Methylococcales bacterium]